MLRLFLFDLCRRFAASERSLRSAALDDLTAIPAELRSDLGLSDARLVDHADMQVRSATAARRARDAQALLDLLSRISRKRGFPAVRWCSEELS